MNHNQAAPEEKHNPIDILLSDPTLARTSAEDPLVKFLKVWWRQVSTVILGGLALFYVFSAYKETRLESMRSSADLFDKTRQEFGAYLSAKRALQQAEFDLANPAKADPKKDLKEESKEKLEKDEKPADPAANLEQSKKNFEEARTKLDKMLLALDDADEPYSKVSQVYRGLLAAYESDGAKLSQTLSPFSGLVGSEAADQLVPEVGNLVLARGMLDNPSTAAEGRKLLVKLVQTARYVNVVAASVLAKISTTTEEKGEAFQAIQQLVEKHPEQIDLLREELDRLKPQS